MSTNKKQKDILYVAISSFILTIAWVGFSIYHNMVTSTISQDLQIQIQPIDPSFDHETLQKLKTRESINPAFEAKSAPSVTTEPTPDDLSLSESSATPTTQPVISPSQARQTTLSPTNTQVQ